jgi:hypothetical protein
LLQQGAVFTLPGERDNVVGVLGIMGDEAVEHGFGPAVTKAGDDVE